MVAPIAKVHPARDPLKYGHTRASLFNKVGFTAGPMVPFSGN
jgi:hypothetical protein